MRIGNLEKNLGIQSKLDSLQECFELGNPREFDWVFDSVIEWVMVTDSVMVLDSVIDSVWNSDNTETKYMRVYVKQ
jgi:hypothetical protein